MSDAARAMLCEHANEVPLGCPCAPGCYCKTRTCAPGGLYAHQNARPEPSSEAVRFAVRPMRASDHPRLYSDFLRSYRESDHTECIPNTPFFDVHKQEFAAVLALFTVLVAHPEGEDDEIAGWMAHKGRTVAWIYVKKVPWRGMGVCRLLMEEAGFLPGRPLAALYASSWALRRARHAGYPVTMCSHGEAMRLLWGAG